jgi:hypothetical protein
MAAAHAGGFLLEYFCCSLVIDGLWSDWSVWKDGIDVIGWIGSIDLTDSIGTD